MVRTFIVIAAALGLTACERNGDQNGVDSGTCGSPADLISALQGAALQSPRVGQPATVEAVVVGAFTQGLGGVFLQEEQADRDGDPMTSEGLFVQIEGATPNVSVGDVVRVHGRVAELGDERTSLTALVELNQLRVCGKVDELPQSALLEEAPLMAEDWEAHEGMRLAIDPAVTVIANDSLMRRGELVVSLNGRQFQPTEVALPGAEAEAVAADNQRARVTLDDGSAAAEMPARIAWLPRQPGIDHPYRIGSEIRDVAGVLDQRDGRYRLHVDTPLDVRHAERPESAPEVDGTLRLATMNVLNYFNGDGKGGGFPTARGATTAEELTRQRAKLMSALKAMDADIYALTEVENDGYERRSAIEELTFRLNQSRGRRGEYDYVRFPGTQLGGDQISVAFLYRPRKVKLVGAAVTITDPPFDRGNRAPLAQTFEDAKSGGRFTIVVNHFKSKGCQDASGANQDRGDGQSCYNALRVDAARSLSAWLATHPTGTIDSDVLIVGDLNAYSKEDPIRLLGESGFTPANDERSYSFNWGGASGTLDHVLVTASVRAQLRGLAHWHINSDELPEFDYNLDNKPRNADARLFRSDPFRSADHDPVIVGLAIAPEPVEPTEQADEAGDGEEPTAAPPA